MSRKPIRLSAISALHYFKLVFRSALFLTALVLYLIHRVTENEPFGAVGSQPVFLSIIGAIYAIEMILRFFPSSLESMGCQKQFKKNFTPTEMTKHPTRPL